MPTTIELPQDAARSVAENINIDSASTTTTAVATGGEDLEAGVSEKAKDAKSAPGGAPPAHDDEFLVTLKGREHLDPHSWSVNYRWFLTALSGSLVLNATFASSAPANLEPAFIAHFGVSEEVGILTISIFVVGYMLGPLLWGPLSERYGRRIIFIAAFFPYSCFQIGCALSPNIGALLVFRLLGKSCGCFASAPLANSGAMLSDMWDMVHIGDAMAIFSLMPIAGPALAPMCAGFMYVSGVDWRWIFWVMTIFAFICLVLITIFIPETYVPYILYTEAKRLRKETGDDRWHSAMDKKEVETLSAILGRTVLKPIRMLIEEPMLLAMSLYMSFVYGIIYLCFEAIPIIFVEQHGLNSGEAGMVFLSMAAGSTIGVCVYVFYFNPKYGTLARKLAPNPVPPEVRLQPMLFAAPALAVSLFWLAWTSYPSISIASPILAICLLGSCTFFIFMGCMTYIIDTYLMNAASALSINTVMRSGFGAGFPLFAIQMYTKLGTPGATSLLAGLAVLFIPGPYVLIRYGKRLRMASKNAVMRPGE